MYEIETIELHSCSVRSWTNATRGARDQSTAIPTLASCSVPSLSHVRTLGEGEGRLRADASAKRVQMPRKRCLTYEGLAPEYWRDGCARWRLGQQMA